MKRTMMMRVARGERGRVGRERERRESSRVRVGEGKREKSDVWRRGYVLRPEAEKI